MTVLRSHAQSSFVSGLTRDSLLVEELLPFRHKIERDYVDTLRSSFVYTELEEERGSGSYELVFYQI